MVGFYNYTVILTYLSVLLAGVGMVFAIDGHPGLASMMLALCGVCDMFDGTIARSKKNRTEDEKAFGIQIDSLCDLVSFGVLPAVIGMAYAEGAEVPGHEGFSLEKLVLILLPLFGLIRLAYFNVQESHLQEDGIKRKYYKGLPITSSAVIFTMLFVVRIFFRIPPVTYYNVYCILALVTGILFITPIKVPKPGLKGLIFFAAMGLLILIGVILRVVGVI